VAAVLHRFVAFGYDCIDIFMCLLLNLKLFVGSIVFNHTVNNMASIHACYMFSIIAAVRLHCEKVSSA